MVHMCTAALWCVYTKKKVPRVLISVMRCVFVCSGLRYSEQDDKTTKKNKQALPAPSFSPQLCSVLCLA